MAQWNIKKNNEIYGPFDGRQLKQLAAEGKLHPDDQVSKDGSGWTNAEMVRGLFSRSPAATSDDNQPSSERSVAPAIPRRNRKVQIAAFLILAALISAVGIYGWTTAKQLFDSTEDSRANSFESNPSTQNGELIAADSTLIPNAQSDTHVWQTRAVESEDILSKDLILDRVKVGEPRPVKPKAGSGPLHVNEPCYVFEDVSKDGIAFSPNGSLLVFDKEWAKTPIVIDLLNGEELVNSIPVNDLRMFHRQNSDRLHNFYRMDFSRFFDTCALFNSDELKNALRKEFGATDAALKPKASFLTPNRQYVVHLDSFNKFHFGELTESEFKRIKLEGIPFNHSVYEENFSQKNANNFFKEGTKRFATSIDQAVFSPNSELLVVLSRNTIGVWNTQTQKLLKTINSKSATSFFGFSPSSKIIALRFDEKVVFLNTESFEEIASFPDDEIDVDAHGTTAFFGFLDEARFGFHDYLKIANLETGEISKCRLPDRGRVMKVFGDYCFGRLPTALFIHNIKSDATVLSINAQRDDSEMDVNSIAIDPTGRFIAVRFWNNRLEVFDTFDAVLAR